MSTEETSAPAHLPKSFWLSPVGQLALLLLMDQRSPTPDRSQAAMNTPHLRGKDLGIRGVHSQSLQQTSAVIFASPQPLHLSVEIHVRNYMSGMGRLVGGNEGRNYPR